MRRALPTIKTMVAVSDEMGGVEPTGSQHYHIMSGISESLATDLQITGSHGYILLFDYQLDSLDLEFICKISVACYFGLFAKRDFHFWSPKLA